jgi:hypothetical protein
MPELEHVILTALAKADQRFASAMAMSMALQHATAQLPPEVAAADPASRAPAGRQLSADAARAGRVGSRPPTPQPPMPRHAAAVDQQCVDAVSRPGHAAPGLAEGLWTRWPRS